MPLNLKTQDLSLFFTQVNISTSCLELIKLCNFIIIIIIPFSRNYKGKGYKLLVHCFFGSCAWKSVNYDWSMIFKATA